MFMYKFIYNCLQIQTSPPVDNTHNSGKSEVKTSHPVDNTHNPTKPDVAMQDKKVCFSSITYF